VRVVALDVGNTSVAAVEFAGDAARTAPDWSDHRRRTQDEARDVAEWVARVRARQADAVVVGSVHRFGEALEQALRAAGVARVAGLHRGDAFPIATDVAEPGRVGVDRLAAALAAFTLARGAARVVSVGTAITVDWIDAHGLFRGGAIVPGRRLQARALHDFTDRLPDVGAHSDAASDATPLHLPGRTTEEAIRSGLDVGIPAFVAALVADLARVAADAPVFVTGGDARWLLARAPFAARAEPFLAARGLVLAHASGRLGDSA
jgi:type III pantothenate kinase